MPQKLTSNMRPTRNIFRLIFLTLFLLPAPSLAYVSPGTPTGFVNDYANLFSTEQKSLLERKLSDFEATSTNEISVVTISSLEGDAVENYADKLFQEWGIGKPKTDNGVLLLIAKEDRKMRIEVGYGLEGALTDAISGSIMRTILTPAFREGDYYAGVNEAVEAIILATRGEYIADDNGLSTGNGIFNSFFLLYVAAFFIMYLASILARSKSWWAGGVVGGVVAVLAGSILSSVVWLALSLIVLVPLGLLFDFLVSRAYSSSKKSGHIPPWWIGGGGSHGGRGGGFGGFGGGGSGGGGSSGSW